MAHALRLEELLSRLPGTVRRGHAAPDRAAAGWLSTGLAELDRAAGGGIPRGHLTELRGGISAGATSLAHRLAALAVARGEWVAWVDAVDAFDPASAAAAGNDGSALLWVRPPNLRTALAATEQLLSLGGFALVVLDVAHAVGRSPRRESLARATHPWIRLARAAARARSALLVLPGAAPPTPLPAALRLELHSAEVRWDRAGGAPALLDGLVARVAVQRRRGGASAAREIAVHLRGA